MNYLGILIFISAYIYSKLRWILMTSKSCVVVIMMPVEEKRKLNAPAMLNSQQLGQEWWVKGAKGLGGGINRRQCWFGFQHATAKLSKWHSSDSSHSAVTQHSRRLIERRSDLIKIENSCGLNASKIVLLSHISSQRPNKPFLALASS